MAIIIASVALKNVFLKVIHRNDSSSDTRHSITFSLAFSALFLLGLHGSSIVKILAILSANYAIARVCRGSKLGPILTWAFNVAVLFMNEWHDGYRFGAIHHSLEFLVRLNAIKMYVISIAH